MITTESLYINTYLLTYSIITVVQQIISYARTKKYHLSEPSGCRYSSISCVRDMQIIMNLPVPTTANALFGHTFSQCLGTVPTIVGVHVI